MVYQILYCLLFCNLKMAKISLIPFSCHHICVFDTRMETLLPPLTFFTTLGFAQLDFIRCAQSHTLCVCAVKYFPRITPFHIPIQRRMILRSICWWCTFGWCIWIVFEKEVRRKKRVKYFLRLKWFAGNCTMCSSFKFHPFSSLSQHTYSSNKWENAIKKNSSYNFKWHFVQCILTHWLIPTVSHLNGFSQHEIIFCSHFIQIRLLNIKLVCKCNAIKYFPTLYCIQTFLCFHPAENFFHHSLLIQNQAYTLPAKLKHMYVRSYYCDAKYRSINVYVFILCYRSLALSDYFILICL